MAATQTGLFIHTSSSVHPKQTALISISTNKQQVVEQTWSFSFSEMCPAVWWKLLHCMLFLLPLHSHQTHNHSVGKSNDFMNYVMNYELSIQQKLSFLQILKVFKNSNKMRFNLQIQILSMKNAAKQTLSIGFDKYLMELIKISILQ